MSDKLIKTSGDIAETAEAFAKAIGRAIEGNDVETAKVLSGELREKLEAAEMGKCRRCGHLEVAHWIENGRRVDCRHVYSSGANCGCRVYVSPTEPIITAVSGTLKDTTLAQIAQLAARKSGPMQAFREGKHFATLRRVSYQKSRSGGGLVFEMDITMSRSMELGAAVYVMRVNNMAEARVAAAQLNRIGIDTRTTFVDTEMNLNIVAVAVNRTSKTGRPFISVSLRLPEVSDFGDEFGDMA